ncbi:MAG: NAD-dependent deacylase [Rhodospirillaceae bacterium]
MKLDPHDPIVILTGAGISKESGLDTFRDEGGIWARVRIEDVATSDGFLRNPQRVHQFYNDRRRGLSDVVPNPAHAALADLEAAWPGEVLLVTQNIDDLHERAGSRNLIHMHGELLKARCAFCDTVQPWAGEMSVQDVCWSCGRRGGVRPHVVWFGEVPLEMERIFGALMECALFLSIGTSGHIYPAAGFVSAAGSHGAHTVELNLEPSAGASLFDDAIQGLATTVVPDFVRGLLRRL